MTYIVSPAQAYQMISSNKIAVLDVRSDLAQPDIGVQRYNKNHLPGAYFLHLEKDLSGQKEIHGGNHPLPDIEELSGKLGDIGIQTDTPVLIYDEANEMYAPRAWWLLRHLGVKEVFVLDGGFLAWTEAGYPVTDEVPPLRAASFTPCVQTNDIVSMTEVKERDRENTVLIDSRAYERYTGESEPLYEKAGHIPGAVHYFWQEVLHANGKWKSKEQLEQHFSSLQKTDEIIVSCGSGISACPNFLALQMAGFTNVKLYPGSFSDWISYPENEIETCELNE